MDTAVTLIRGFAATLDLIDKHTVDPAGSAALSGAAALLRGVADYLVDRTPEEAITVLEMLKAHGAKAITKDELDAQLQATLDRAAKK